MAIKLTSDVLRGDAAVSLARAVDAANKRAHESGVDVTDSHITIIQQTSGPHVLWRIDYGPKEAVGRRGDDLIIDVDATDAIIAQVLHGQ